MSSTELELETLDEELENLESFDPSDELLEQLAAPEVAGTSVQLQRVRKSPGAAWPLRAGNGKIVLAVAGLVLCTVAARLGFRRSRKRSSEQATKLEASSSPKTGLGRKTSTRTRKPGTRPRTRSSTAPSTPSDSSTPSTAPVKANRKAAGLPGLSRPKLKSTNPSIPTATPLLNSSPTLAESAPEASVTTPASPKADAPTPLESTDAPTPVETTESPTPAVATESPTPAEATESPTPVETTESPTPAEATESPTPAEATESPTPVEETESATPLEVTVTPLQADAAPTSSLQASDSSVTPLEAPAATASLEVNGTDGTETNDALLMASILDTTTSTPAPTETPVAAPVKIDTGVATEAPAEPVKDESKSPAVSPCQPHSDPSSTPSTSNPSSPVLKARAAPHLSDHAIKAKPFVPMSMSSARASESTTPSTSPPKPSTPTLPSTSPPGPISYAAAIAKPANNGNDPPLPSTAAGPVKTAVKHKDPPPGPVPNPSNGSKKPVSYAAILGGKADTSADSSASASPEAPKSTDDVKEVKVPAMKLNANAAPFVPPPSPPSPVEIEEVEEEVVAVDEEGAVYEQTPLILAGKDIAADAHQTPDEATADQRLVTIAQSLQEASGGEDQQHVIEQGVQDMLRDVEYCVTHQVRPAKYAEHASTAADFFFQVECYDEAGTMLGGAIQGAAACGNYKLEATLINNMGTVLRRQNKFHTALSLHRHQMTSVVEQHGLTSHYVILARHNLVEALENLSRHDEAEALLLEQTAATSKLAQSDASADSATNGATVSGTNTTDNAEEDSCSSPAACHARCELDVARFMGRCDRLDDAIAHSRTALDLANTAHGKGTPPTAVYLSFCAGMLRTKGDQEEDAEAMKECLTHFEALVPIAESTGERTLLSLYKSLAEINLSLNQPEKAFEYADKTIQLMATLSGGNVFHPSLKPIWKFVENLHHAAGDHAGAQIAAKSAAKCKHAKPYREKSKKQSRRPTNGQR